MKQSQAGEGPGRDGVADLGAAAGRCRGLV